jgi:predicted CXXCH cytochrome family protein
MFDEISDGSVHESFAKGRCFTCHDEHASDNDFQLLEEGADNCYGCHKNIQTLSQKSKHTHMPIRDGKCTSCHNPHGSKIKGRLNRPAGSLCLSCHSGLALNIEKDEFQHAPAKERMCLKCHVPHYANIENLLTGKGVSLCKGCHNLNNPAMADAHSGIAINKTDCIGCHETHSAENKGLMHKVLHPPFKEGNCKKCH